MAVFTGSNLDCRHFDCKPGNVTNSRAGSEIYLHICMCVSACVRPSVRTDGLTDGGMGGLMRECMCLASMFEVK